MKKVLTMVLCIVLTAAIAVGGTLAVLTMVTSPITNVFTFGNIVITLSDVHHDGTNTTADNTLNTYDKFRPESGAYLQKEPKITVLPGSESCYVFIKVEKANSFDTFFEELKINAGWTLLSQVIENGVTSTVYYYNTAVDASNATTPTELPCVLDPNAGADNTTAAELKVKTTYTSSDVSALNKDYPKLTFTGYAVQTTGYATALEAWNDTFGK